MKRVLALVLCGLLLGACTFVPADGQPHVVNPNTVPFNLLSKHQPGGVRTPPSVL